ncbi:MAG TPA: hypothetical protein VF159_00015 [Gemmatimonadaceae bacterium]
MDIAIKDPDLPRMARAIARLIPVEDRQAILGDLVEEADHRDLLGPARAAWLSAECLAIAAGLSVEAARGWFVMPPMREVAAGLAIGGRGTLHDGAAGTLIQVLVYVGSVATLVLGATLLVGSLMAAAGL